MCAYFLVYSLDIWLLIAVSFYQNCETSNNCWICLRFSFNEPVFCFKNVQSRVIAIFFATRVIASCFAGILALKIIAFHCADVVVVLARMVVRSYCGSVCTIIVILA
jgi:hypothetical protein